jgi:hypothetical protein
MSNSATPVRVVFLPQLPAVQRKQPVALGCDPPPVIVGIYSPAGTGEVTCVKCEVKELANGKRYTMQQAQSWVIRGPIETCISGASNAQCYPIEWRATGFGTDGSAGWHYVGYLQPKMQFEKSLNTLNTMIIKVADATLDMKGTQGEGVPAPAPSTLHQWEWSPIQLGTGPVTSGSMDTGPFHEYLSPFTTGTPAHCTYVFGLLP